MTEGVKPIQVEHLSASSEKSFTEAQTTLHHSFLQKGNAVEAKFKEHPEARNAATQAEKDLNWYSFFKNTKDTPPNTEAAPMDILPAGPNAGMRMVVIEADGKMKPQSFLKRGETVTAPKDSSVITLSTFNGKRDGLYRFVTTDSQVIEMPESDFLALFAYTHQDSLNSALTGPEATVAQAVFAQIKDPSKDFAIDNAVLSEAVEHSGQISTKAIATGMRKNMPKKELPVPLADDASVEDQAKYDSEKSAADDHNRLLDKLFAGIEDHAIATPADMSQLLSLYNERGMEAEMKQLSRDITEWQSQLHTARATDNVETVTRLTADIDAAEVKMKRMKDAQEIFQDPEQLITFFNIIKDGKVSSEAMKSINAHLAEGEVSEAMVEIAVANFESLDEEKQEEVAKFLGVDRATAKTVILALGGGSLALLVLMIMQGMQGGK